MRSRSTASGAGMADMPPPDIHHLIPSGMQAVRRVLDQTHKQILASDGNAALSDTAQIILGEILNNVVEHAYGFEAGHPIEMSIWFRRDGLQCEVRDSGIPMPDGKLPNSGMPRINSDRREDLPEGGFGWALVHELTEELLYERLGTANRLRFLIPSVP